MDDLDIISATSWRQVFLEENTGIFGENYRPTNVPQANDKPDQLYCVHLTTILRSRP